MKNSRSMIRYSELSGKWMHHIYENITPNEAVPLEKMLWLPNQKN